MRKTILALALLVPAAGHAATLYADLGAKDGVAKLVEQAAAIWTADPRIAATFEETNMVRFKQKLAEQLCQVTDGGCAYTGQNMHDAHKGLHLDTRQFNVLVEDLQKAMDRLDIAFPTQNRLLAVLAPMYRDVVTK